MYIEDVIWRIYVYRNSIWKIPYENKYTWEILYEYIYRIHYTITTTYEEYINIEYIHIRHYIKKIIYTYMKYTLYENYI